MSMSVGAAVAGGGAGFLGLAGFLDAVCCRAATLLQAVSASLSLASTWHSINWSMEHKITSLRQCPCQQFSPLGCSIRSHTCFKLEQIGRRQACMQATWQTSVQIASRRACRGIYLDHAILSRAQIFVSIRYLLRLQRAFCKIRLLPQALAPPLSAQGRQ